MVSLSSDRTHSGGYYGFSDACSVINSDEDLIVDHIELVSGEEIIHQPLKTTWAIILTQIIFGGLVVSVYIMPYRCDTGGACEEDPLPLTMYIHGGIWFILCVLDRYLRYKHDESRLLGYLDFYRKTRNIRRMPLFINSCANAVLVIVIKVLDNYCDLGGKCKFLRKINYLQILISIECVVALIVLTVFLVYTLKFNITKALPDVSDTGLFTSFESTYLSSELGFRNDGDYIYQVLEKQGDMIRYLQQHTEILARRNLTLTEEVNRLKVHNKIIIS